MQKCKYSERLKCDECTFPFYKECPRFVGAHAMFLSDEIRPFRFVNNLDVPAKVVTSRDMQKAKSAALKFAIRMNQPVKKVTVNQVLNIVLSGLDFEGKVIYIEYAKRVSGDADKVDGVVNSFIENATLRGACISIYLGAEVKIISSNYQHI